LPVRDAIQSAYDMKMKGKPQCRPRPYPWYPDGQAGGRIVRQTTAWD